jgi:hypothetical protein
MSRPVRIIFATNRGYEKYDENAFGINDKYSYKTNIKFGKYASIYATKRFFFSKSNK